MSIDAYMDRLMRYTGVAATVILAAGCATAPTPSPLVITTDSSQYTLPSDLGGGTATVRIVAQNVGAQTLYTVPHGCGIQVDRKSNGQWISPQQTCGVYVGSIPLAANAQFTDSVSVNSAGTYRVTLLYSSDSGQTATKQSMSNSFGVSN